MMHTIESPVAGPQKYKSYSASRTISKVLSYVFLIILSIIWLYPILWIIVSSFRVSTSGDIVSVGIPSTYFPDGVKETFGFQNYLYLFQDGFGERIFFGRWFLTTLIIAVCSCVISTAFTLMVAYVMSKLQFSFRKTYLNIALIIGLFPGFMSMVAIYYLLTAMGLTEYPELGVVALILCNSAGAGTGFYVAKGFFDVIPNSLMESARLDGATNAQIFWHIILPMSKPIVIYQALMAFTGPWMDFIFARVILGEDAKYWTVSVGLYQTLNATQSDGTVFSIGAAGCVMVAIPIVTLFMFLQKYYVEGVTAGSVK